MENNMKKVLMSMLIVSLLGSVSPFERRKKMLKEDIEILKLEIKKERHENELEGLENGGK